MNSRRFKYVIVNGTYPRLCSEAETHKSLAGGLHVTSAGFARLDIDPASRLSVSCFGESVSLKVKSDPIDSMLIERMFSDPI